MPNPPSVTVRKAGLGIAKEIYEDFWTLTDSLPKRNAWRFGEQFPHLGQHTLHMWFLQMRVQILFTRPVFVKMERRRVAHGLVQIVFEATGIVAAGNYQ